MTMFELQKHCEITSSLFEGTKFKQTEYLVKQYPLGCQYLRNGKYVLSKMTHVSGNQWC